MLIENYPEFVAGRAKFLPSLDERVNHSLLGMIGEVGELADAWKKHLIYEQPLDRTNLLEELGDLRFYVQMYLNEGFTVHQIMNWDLDVPQGILALAVTVGKLTKLLPYYMHKAKIEEHLSDIVYIIDMMAESLDTTGDQIILMNMEKLTTRYPDGYSNAHAAARLDKV